MLRNRGTVETKLQSIADKARNDPNCRFTSLFHLMNEELLMECFGQLRGNAASGVDQITKSEYGKNLEENLENLVGRLHRMSYIPKPALRVLIPKPGSSKERPLGIPAFEDKLVQAGLAKILTAIYEADFVESSYGFRPNRGCHDALRAVTQIAEKSPVNYIVDADIKGFFDNVNHKWMIRFLEHRIADKRVIRYIWRFLKAGIIKDGLFVESDIGTPQGGIISPILANIYLHYSLDLWFEKSYRRTCNGYAGLVRYADDFVVFFQMKSDAIRFVKELEIRLNKFGLETAPEKTKMIEFGAVALLEAERRGTKPDSFDFLGFKHYCGKTRDGKRFRVKRKTSSKKFSLAIIKFKEWLKRNRIRPTKELMGMVASKLRGHNAYYGVTDNSKGISRYTYEVKKTLHKWLNRRGRRGYLNWDKFNALLKRYSLPDPHIQVSMWKKAPSIQLHRQLCLFS